MAHGLILKTGEASHFVAVGVCPKDTLEIRKAPHLVVVGVCHKQGTRRRQESHGQGMLKSSLYSGTVHVSIGKQVLETQHEIRVSINKLKLNNRF